MTTTARATTTVRIPAKWAPTNLSLAAEAARGDAARTDGLTDGEARALADGRGDALYVDPVKAGRKAAIARLAAATLVADGARLTALASADVIDSDRLPESGAYRATVRNWLDAMCASLEAVHAAATCAKATFDSELHPIAYAHYLAVADAAWAERMRWAVLRDEVKRAGR